MNKFEALQPMFETNLRNARRWIPQEAWKESKGEVGINVVFGIANDELPARFLAGFILTISLADAFESQTKPVQMEPEVRIFIPMSLAEACGVSPEHAREVKEEGLLFVEKFQSIFHPNVALFADIEHQMTINHKLHLHNFSLMVLDSYEDIVKEEWNEIKNSATRRGKPQTALMYASHGVFGWQDIREGGLIRFFDANPKRITINCMSKAEEPFRIFHSVIRQIHSERANENHGIKSVDLLTTVCRRPHYQRVDIGSHQEPTLKDLRLFGFEKTHTELVAMATLSDKFKRASDDLDLINTHIERLRVENNLLPNIEEFIQEVKNAFDNQ